MEGIVKRTGAALLALFLALTVVSLGFAQPAHAETKQWYFSFSKSDGKHVCGPAKKQNNTSYIKVQVKEGKDNAFKPAKSILGLRGRTDKRVDAPDNKATEYNVFFGYTENGRLKYLSGKGINGKSYYLHGQVDSKSQTNIIQVWGYWTP